MWSRKKAQKLLADFKRRVNALPSGISGKRDAGGKENSPNLYEAVKGHGLKYTRKRSGGGKIAGGYILMELEEFAEMESLDQDIVEDLEDYRERLINMMSKESDLNPANIKFRGVIKFKKGKGGKNEVERGEVWGHFLTPAYHAFRKDKAKRKGESYDMPLPDSKWTSLKDDGSARPPLWQALFGEGGLKDLVDAFIKMVGDPIDIPPTPEVEVANVRRKRGNLAEVPAVRRMVEEILQDKSLYAKNTNSPVNSRLKDAFNSKTIAVTEEDMKMIGPLVFMKVDGRDVRLSEIPGYLERRSIGLNFTYTMLRELIREVLGEREKTYETPYHKEGKVKSRGLVLKAVEARKNLLKALADIDPSERHYYDNLQDIIDACSTYDMDDYVPALELATLEMGRMLNIRVVPMTLGMPIDTGDASVDLGQLAPSYFMYIGSTEPNMNEPKIYAINVPLKMFRRHGGNNQDVSANQLMQDIRGFIA
tara:strand:- start:66 stop:1502 length:1437 start_codon:yes stop_codon:yes gene_type:complete